MMPGGQMADAVVITSDRLMERDPRCAAAGDPHEAAARRPRRTPGCGPRRRGIPAHVKLNVPEGKSIDTLIVNVAECEPYITSDHREALENSENVLHGVYKIKEILGVHRVLIAIEDNKPDAIEALRKIADNAALDPNDEVRVLPLRAMYPQGAGKGARAGVHGAQSARGRPAGRCRLLVMNIASGFRSSRAT